MGIVLAALWRLNAAATAVRDASDLDRCHGKLDRVLQDDHRADVVGMLERVAAANGRVTPEVTASLERYRRNAAAAAAVRRTQVLHRDRVFAIGTDRCMFGRFWDI